MSRAKRHLFVLDDDPEVVSYLSEELEREGFSVAGSTDPAEALARIERESFDLVVSDIEMPGMRGTDLLAAIQTRRPGQLVVLITAFGSIDLAVRSIHAGAADFVAKPFRIEALLLVVERALRERQMRHEIVRLRRRLAEEPDPTVIAVSPAMRRAVDLARRAAGTDATVLLTGESGTGKGELARIIHESGPRRAGAFVRLNAAALPASLVESELFGVKRGAFTDAKEDRKGLFVAASSGTLFLDEVGELAPETQAKLLHVLESGRVRPVGSVDELDAHARVVAATNRPLETLMAEGHFRADLYYRINVIRIDVPPLRDRREDLLPLIDGLLGRACERLGRPVAGISKDAMRILMAHDWPGNVRELANTLERAVALSDHDTIVTEDLSDIGTRTNGAGAAAPPLGLTLAEVARDYARRMLDAHEGNKAAAARALDIDRRTLYRMLGNGDGDEAVDS